MPSKRELLRLANEKNQARRMQAIGAAEHTETVTDAILEAIEAPATPSVRKYATVAEKPVKQANTAFSDEMTFLPAVEENVGGAEKHENTVTQMTTTKLSAEHERFLKIRSAQQHYSQLKYVEKLILEFRESVKSGKRNIDPFSFEMPAMGRYTVQKSLIMQKSTYQWLCDFTAGTGLKKTDFINYLIELDMTAYQSQSRF